MPFVSRPSPQPYDPINLRSLIAHYDTSITTSLDISGVFLNNIIDQTRYRNNLVGQNVYVYNILLSSSFLLNNQTEMSYKTTGVTVFYVGSPGFPIRPTDIISIFGTSNSSLVSSSNTAFLRIDSNNYLYATNGINNAGANTLLVNDYNIPKIITGIFNKTTSTLRISGNNYGSSNCPNTFEGSDNNYVIQIGTPDNLYIADNERSSSSVGDGYTIQNINGIFEVIVYNSALLSEEISRIEQYLEQKWQITYPAQDFRTYPDVMQIPHLFLWLDATNISKMIFSDVNNTELITFNSSENNCNTFIADAVTAVPPIYNSNDKRINFAGTGASPLFPKGLVPVGSAQYDNIDPLFTGIGDIYGITICTLLTAKPIPFNADIDRRYTTILAAFTPQDPDILLSQSYPTILQSVLGSIIINSNILPEIFSKSLSLGLFNYGVNALTSSSYTNDPFLLTVQFTESNTSMWINDYPVGKFLSVPDFSLVPVFNNILSYKNTQSLGCYIGGVPAVPTPGDGYRTCSTEIGEVLIYKKALTSNERNIVKTHIYSNYNISPNISTDGLVGWWDTTNISGGPISNWASKYGTAVLSNITENSIPYVRSYNDPLSFPSRSQYSFVDFNNGVPAAMGVDMSNSYIDFDISANGNISIFMVTSANYNSNGTILHTMLRSNSDTAINCSYNDVDVNMVFNLNESTTTVKKNLGNNIFISTYSILNSTTANIYSIPASGSNFLYSETIPINYENSYISIGGECDPLSPGPTLSNFFRNSIGELIIYDRALSNGEYVNILAYLQSKWGIPNISFDVVTDPLLWYDANDIIANTNTWSSHGNLGPDLITATLLQVTNLNNNNFFMVGGGNLPVFSDISASPISITENYTFFIVSKGEGFDGPIVSLSPTNDRTFNYPGLYMSNDRYMIISGDDEPFTNSDKCYSRFIDPTYPTVDLTGNINITCINHSFNSSTSKGSYTIRSKGTFYEQSASNVDESPFANSNVRLSIGGQSGLIGEFLFYNESLDDMGVLGVFSYLEGKWLNSGGPAKILLLDS